MVQPMAMIPHGRHESLVRKAQTEDASQIAAIHVRSWQVTYAGFLNADFLATLNISEWAERWRQRLETLNARETVLVAIVDDAIAGFVNVGNAGSDAEPTLGELRAIYLDPAKTGHGIGGALHEAGLAALSHLGYSRAVLWVAADNGNARAFYEHYQWQPTGTPQLKALFGTSILSQQYERALP
jgi:GNAT superfamily N-acetyltransferase